jgi:hypothetical protein
MDLPLFKAKITDWRSQVDCLMIDTAYDGSVFNVVLSDVPEKKNDLIEGTYKLAVPQGKTAVAVKIIDMLGACTAPFPCGIRRIQSVCEHSVTGNHRRQTDQKSTGACAGLG